MKYFFYLIKILIIFYVNSLYIVIRNKKIVHQEKPQKTFL